ncbi:MAG: SGNH/GDSL hydrolase family protein [Lentisphaerae bacterium]|nr:SGNH/GDSL hydrolase family protein [Lentisphaerota bacterium]
MALDLNHDLNSPLLLRVSDVQGTYTIPYIQTAREVALRVAFADSGCRRARVLLEGSTEGRVSVRLVSRDRPIARFAPLAPGHYTVRVEYRDAGEGGVAAKAWEGLGIGCILAALGDSLTEGYHGRAFRCDNLHLTSAVFPEESVSRDGRNFPQFGPTAAVHTPAVNCFESWMTRLNNSLTETWKQPVFIANEGWGNCTTSRYLAMIRGNEGGWRDRMHLLRPNVWLIHLGVNDERRQVSPAEFTANLHGIVDALIVDFGAVPERIFLARPSYDYICGAAEVLRQYILGIDAVIGDVGLGKGPDFFAAFARDRARWYGDDPVHPGVEGMDRMADLWAGALPDRLHSVRSAPARGAAAG